MAAIKLNDLILYDKMPGPINPNMGKPAGGWDSTTVGGGNCVTTPSFQVGTKIMAYEDNSRAQGWYVMQYLRFHEGTDLAQDVGDVSDGYGMCFHAEGTAAGDTTTGDYTYTPWYVVTNDLTNSDGTRRGAACFPANDLSHNEYGWCWVGGVCPISDVTRFVVSGEITGCDLKTNGDVLIGQEVIVVDDGTNCGALAPHCPTETYDVTVVGDATVATTPIGWVTNTDA